jgi:hypothetical protein
VDASLAYLAFLAYLAKAAQAVGMTTITAGRKRRALDAAWELVQSRSCITMRELAHELASVDDFRVILIALSDSDLVVTTPDKLREDPADNMEATWGPIRPRPNSLRLDERAMARRRRRWIRLLQTRCRVMPRPRGSALVRKRSRIA